MKIFIAGATGAIGRPLTKQLLLQGHEVFGMTRSERGRDILTQLGATPLICDALDSASIESALKQCQPDVVIEMLTSLPKEYTPETMKKAAEENTSVRLEGGANLQKAAEKAGVRRYIMQSSAFWYAPGDGFASEGMPFATDPTLPIHGSAKVYKEQEERLFSFSSMECIALRFGFFYGPGTWYAKGGSLANQVETGTFPVIGDGEGFWNFVHIEDAALAVTLALSSQPGAYNITDGKPLPQSVWLPAYAKWLGAPPPPQKTVEEALETSGPIAVYYAIQLRGASNEKAVKELGFAPRQLEWL